MYLQLRYRERFSIRVIIILFIIEVLEALHRNLEIRLINSLIRSFNRSSRIHKILLAKQDSMSKKIAFRWIKTINHPLSVIDKLESSVKKTNNTELKESFYTYKKSLFRLEATLHKIYTNDNDIIETPEYIKNGISKIGLSNTLSNLN